ncbi:MAG: hypothetical protein RR495_03895 [Anaerovoracaceae bacterium]
MTKIRFDDFEFKELCNDIFESLLRINNTLNMDPKQLELMVSDINKIRDTISSKIQLNVTYSIYNDIKINGRTLTINDEKISCNGFSKISPNDIKGVIIYGLSINEAKYENLTILDQVYSDLYGTACVDAGRKLIHNMLEQKYLLSESFGPGFYGMPVKEIDKFSNLINLNEANMFTSEYGLLPSKSVIGMYFVVNNDYKKINDSCSECIGSKEGCKLCQLNME